MWLTGNHLSPRTLAGRCTRGPLVAAHGPASCVATQHACGGVVPCDGALCRLLVASMGRGTAALAVLGHSARVVGALWLPRARPVASQRACGCVVGAGFAPTASLAAPNTERSVTLTFRCAAAYFTDQHEWVTVNGSVATVGITDYAQVSPCASHRPQRLLRTAHLRCSVNNLWLRCDAFADAGCWVLTARACDRTRLVTLSLSRSTSRAPRLRRAVSVSRQSSCSALSVTPC